MTEAQEELSASPAVREELQRTLSIREVVLDALLEKVDGERYPSPTMLDDIESLLTPWRRDDYAEILLAKVQADRFPSSEMIKRLIRLSG
jgi:hypothetical protein